MGNPRYNINSREVAEAANQYLTASHAQRVGNEIIVPLKFKNPLKLSEIPRQGQLKIIDNFVLNGKQANFNYIVEGDKIYYSRKGLTDNWVDISDNDTARKNLFEFLKTNYDFKGYNSGEKVLYESIANGTFDYNFHHTARVHQQVLNTIIAQNNHVSEPKTDPQHTPSISNKLDNKQQGGNSTDNGSGHNFYSIPLVYSNEVFEEMNSAIPWNSSTLRSPWYRPFHQNSAHVENKNTSTVKNTDTQRRIISDTTLPPNANIWSFEPQNTYHMSRITLPHIYDTPRNNNSLLDPVVKFGEKIYDFVDGKWNEYGGNPGAIFNTIFNGIERQWEKWWDSPESVPSFHGKSLNTPGEYGIIPGSYVGDTIPTNNNRRYIIPESLDINGYTFAHRNRGQNTPIASESAPITAFSPFKLFGQHEKGYSTYIGVDKNGKFKVGDISIFGEGDYLTGTFSNKVYDFVKDANGNYKWQSDDKHGNGNHNVPIVRVEHNGKIIESAPINVLARKSDKKGTTYGNVTGGRVLVQVGNELRLLSGSVANIDAEFTAMKKRQGVDYGIFYTLDNGSYNRALRTYDKKFTKKDLEEYDRQNVGNSGNFLYITGRTPNVFKQDTIWTPNKRTEKDKSYKEGHPLQNSVEGVVFHHTAFENDPNMTEVTKHFRDPKTEASAHVVINTNGDRRIFANPEDVTFHAGSSKFGDRLNVNDFMIGVEFQGNTLNTPLTEAQINSAVEYLIPLIRKYNISLENLVTHEMIRHAYNQYARENKLKVAPNKPDITYSEFEKIIEKLKEKIYYKN